MSTKTINTYEAHIIDGVEYFICDDCGFKKVWLIVLGKEAICYDKDIPSSLNLFRWFCVCGKEYYFTKPYEKLGENNE